jgi:hypothetical protein
MRVEIQLRIVGDDGTVLSDNAVLRLDRADHRLGAVGLSLAEAKTLLADVQNRLVAAQASDYVVHHRPCPACGRRRSIKGYERHRQLDRRLTTVGQLAGVGAALVCDYAARRTPEISAQSSKAWARAVR